VGNWKKKKKKKKKKEHEEEEEKMMMKERRRNENLAGSSGPDYTHTYHLHVNRSASVTACGDCE